MKRLFAILLILALALTVFVACRRDTEEPDTPDVGSGEPSDSGSDGGNDDGNGGEAAEIEYVNKNVHMVDSRMEPLKLPEMPIQP